MDSHQQDSTVKTIMCETKATAVPGELRILNTLSFFEPCVSVDTRHTLPRSPKIPL